MRLINCTTLAFEEFIGKHKPQYAILSHTWEAHEISFKDYCDVDELKLKPGSAKILTTCETALKMGYNYVWIDTCMLYRASSSICVIANSLYAV
jgi:hypothetical protein